MTTSGITIKEITRDDIITRALRKIGVIGEGVAPTATQLSEGADALGPLVQEMITLGMPLWKLVEYAIPMISGKSTYTLGIGQEYNVPYPVKIVEAILQQSPNSAKINIEILSAYDYNLLPSNSSGVVVNMKYQPFINFGTVSVWPTPNTSNQVLTLSYYRPFEVFNAGTDTPDFPQEWQNALIYQLALILSDEYGLSVPDKQWIERQAEKRLANALANGTEQGSLKFYPSRVG